MPRLLKFDPTRIPSMWPHCFLATHPPQEDEITIDYIGSTLAAYSSGSDTWSRGGEVPGDSFLAIPLRAIPLVGKTAAPVLLTGQLVSGKQEIRKFRAIVLPLADREDRLAYYLGAASSKTFAASQEDCMTSWDIATLQNGRWTTRETITGDD